MLICDIDLAKHELSRSATPLEKFIFYIFARPEVPFELCRAAILWEYDEINPSGRPRGAGEILNTKVYLILNPETGCIIIIFRHSLVSDVGF
ncbi:hypothetical protein [uncultured Roseibium sp.]|uniref:hypothetical protein n=1 Tax=uncultured Roseibium sp. TaxID=1936171 RepID=UPI003216CC43